MVDINLSFIRSEETTDALHQDGFAGTVIANNTVDFSLFKGVGYVFQHFFLTKGLTDT